jgi:hypothetical protein
MGLKCALYAVQLATQQELGANGDEEQSGKLKRLLIGF